MAWNDYGIENTVTATITPQKPFIGGIYRHFKGDLYQVIGFAKDETERTKELVIYRSLMFGETWARELSVFMSKVDRDKYPEVEQEDRFLFVGKPQYITLI